MLVSLLPYIQNVAEVAKDPDAISIWHHDWRVELVFLLIVGISSFAGGFLQGLFPYLGKDTAPLKFWPDLIISGLFGIGGGMAVMLVFTWIGKCPTPGESYLEVIFLSVVAGFVGHRILPTVAGKLEKRLDSNEEKINIIDQQLKLAKEEIQRDFDEAKRGLNEVQKRIQIEQRRILQIQKDVKKKENRIDKHRKELDRTHKSMLAIKFRVLLSDEKKEGELRTIGRSIQKCVKKYGPISPFSMLLAHYHKKVSEYDSAIKVMEAVLEKIKESPEEVSNLAENEGNKDKGLDFYLQVGYYNIACYKTLKSTCVSGEEKEKLLEEVFQMLEEAISLYPTNKKDAQNDEDFQSIWASQKFIEITEAVS